ncbi:cytochrome c-type biogenesis protein [Roseateles sp. BYS96W]|uniref:Cytochrome c-type biogenesis protein n=1 Tax=Pelomonas nitida TaxID=3299027 RepID=A0ABW7GCW7_9BURK
MRQLLIGLSLLACSAGALADIDAREAALAAQLRCVVCQNQTVAESNAPLATDMRREIRAQLHAGRSDADVLAFFEQRYGAFVRYTPPLRPSTWLLWGLPFVLGLAGLAALVATLRRRNQAVPAEPLDDAQRERARRLLDREDA